MRQDLLQIEAASLLELLLDEATTEAQIAAILVALANKGETAGELAGFAETMRALAAPVETKHTTFIDTCGTGGSAVKTFNVSTTAAFIVAAAGVSVAKHGNVGVTSSSGSADVLRALGVKVDLAPERVTDIFEAIGLCFMFAPLHHAATKRVAKVRRELGIRTIFNYLGPLTNPAGAPFQLLGVSNEAMQENMAQALERLGTKRAWVLRGADGLDEITLATETVVYEVTRHEDIRRFTVAPEDFGLPRAAMTGLRVADAEQSAQTVRAVLAGERTDAARDLALMNAAAALMVADAATSYADAYAKAFKVIANGAALEKLEQLKKLSHAEPQNL